MASEACRDSGPGGGADPGETVAVVIDLAGLSYAGYQAYGDRVGWKNFRGDPMPRWDDLGAAIQDAWGAAARQVAEDVAGGLLQRLGWPR